MISYSIVPRPAISPVSEIVTVAIITSSIIVLDFCFVFLILYPMLTDFVLVFQ